MPLVAMDEAVAQLCANNPVQLGRPALSASVGFGACGTSSGLGLQATPVNRLVLSGSYSAADIDDLDVRHYIGAGAGYRRPLGSGLVCPWAAVALSQPLDRGDWGSSAGIAASIGATIGKKGYRNGLFRLTPFVGASYGVANSVSRMMDGGWSDSYSASGGALFFLTDRMFGTGSVSVAEGGRTGASIRLGLLLR